jgi:anti-anti-sigma factor
MTASLKVTERKPGIQIAAISGSLDSNTSPDIEARLVPLLIPATDVLTLDLRDLEYISSAGVRVVFKARKAIEGHGGKFILTNLQPPVRKVFEIINALPKENIFTSLKEVDDYLDLMQKRVRSGGTAEENE